MATTISNNNTTTNPLKRKRPPKLEIPKVLQEIENGGNCDDYDDGAVCYSGNGFCVSSVKGKKKFMEDTHKVVSSCLESLGYNAKGFFGVYDGHGGRKAADFVAENLHTNMIEILKNSLKDGSKEEAVRAAYLKTDEEFLKQGLESGACCVTALIEGTDLLVSNLGDCRAVLSRSGVAEALSKDHIAEREDEKRRIEDEGGYVEYHKGAWRVHGVLSVSRSIGDAHLKNWVVAEPDTQVLHMTPDMDFLVLASDGLWTKVANQEAVDTVTRFKMEKKQGLASCLELDCDNDDYGCVNASPPSKIRRVSLVKQQKETAQSLTLKKIVDNSKDSLSGANCKKRSPSLNTPRISLAKRGSLVRQQKAMIQSPSKKKTADSIKYDADCENRCPPINTPRISLAKHAEARPKSPCQENSVYSQGSSPAGLLAACKELVKLAVSRGCLDDITVIIVDLNLFKCNS